MADQRADDGAGRPPRRSSERRGGPKPEPPGSGRRRANPGDLSRDRRRAEAGSETTLRGLVGAGPSRVGPVAAMRARDVARPGPDELERAERDVVIRRREGTQPTTGPSPAGPFPDDPVQAGPASAAGGFAPPNAEPRPDATPDPAAAGPPPDGPGARKPPAGSGSRRRGR